MSYKEGDFAVQSGKNGVSAEAAFPGLRTEARFLQVLQSKVEKGEIWPAGNSLVQKL